MHLFDPEPFTDGTPRAPRTRKVAPEPERCRLGHDGWALVSVSKNPEAHVLLDEESANRVRREMKRANYGASITLCRKAGTPLTFDVDTVAAACSACVTAGARTSVA